MLDVKEGHLDTVTEVLKTELHQSSREEHPELCVTYARVGILSPCQVVVGPPSGGTFQLEIQVWEGQ